MPRGRGAGFGRGRSLPSIHHASSDISEGSTLGKKKQTDVEERLTCLILNNEDDAASSKEKDLANITKKSVYFSENPPKENNDTKDRPNVFQNKLEEFSVRFNEMFENQKVLLNNHMERVDQVLNGFQKTPSPTKPEIVRDNSAETESPSSRDDESVEDIQIGRNYKRKKKAVNPSATNIRILAKEFHIGGHFNNISLHHKNK